DWSSDVCSSDLPCVKELPYFEDLSTHYAKQNVEVILVSLDFPKTYETSLKPFLKEKKLQTKVVALDDANFNSWIPQVHTDWSGRSEERRVGKDSRTRRIASHR